MEGNGLEIHEHNWLDWCEHSKKHCVIQNHSGGLIRRRRFGCLYRSSRRKNVAVSTAIANSAGDDQNPSDKVANLTIAARHPSYLLTFEADTKMPCIQFSSKDRNNHACTYIATLEGFHESVALSNRTIVELLNMLQPSRIELLAISIRA